MPNLFRDLMKSRPAAKKTSLEQRMINVLLEMKAADRCFLETGKQWDDLTNVEQRRVIDVIRQELSEQERQKKALQESKKSKLQMQKPRKLQLVPKKS